MPNLDLRSVVLDAIERLALLSIENFYRNRVEKYTYKASKKKIERLISENIEI